MGQIIKGYLGVFLVLLIMVTSVGILSAYMGMIQAQDFHALVIDEMENSNYAGKVMEEEFRQAKNAGYELEITLFYPEGKSKKISSSSLIPSDTMEASYARINLHFPLRIAFFEVNQKHMLSGYAR